MYELEPGVLQIYCVITMKPPECNFPPDQRPLKVCVFFALIRDNICLAPMILLTRASQCWPLIGRLWPKLASDWPYCHPLPVSPSLPLSNKTYAYNSLCLTLIAAVMPVRQNMLDCNFQEEQIQPSLFYLKTRLKAPSRVLLFSADSVHTHKQNN